MYTVLSKTFATFEEVVSWAWNEHKIDAHFTDVMDEDDKQQACKELEEMLTLVEEEL